jgi:hypothetical protein
LKSGIGVGIGERMYGKEFGENQKFKMAIRGSFSMKKMIILPVDNHVDHKVGPIVFILGENIAKCKDMPYGGSAEIGNSKWPPRGFFWLIFRCKNDTFAYSSPW